MADSAPALKTLLKLIGRKYLKQMFNVCKVETQTNWSEFSETFEDDLCVELTNIAKNGNEAAKKSFAEICTLLFDINAVCRDQKRGRYIIDKIKESGRLSEAFGDWQTERPDIHQMVSWVFLNMRELWEFLRKNAIIKIAFGLGGQKKYVAKPANDIASDLQRKAFEDEFLSFMAREHTMVSFVHTDMEDLGNCVRYVFHVNAFPKNVEQYDDEGKFVLALDHNAEGFTIIYYREPQPFFRIKCFFSTSQTKRIAQLFAKFMLSTDIIDKPIEEYPIEKFNPTYSREFRLKVSSSEIAVARVSGVTLEITNPDTGIIDELTHRCKTDDIFDRLQESCAKFPVAWRRPKMWEFTIDIYVEERRQVQLVMEQIGVEPDKFKTKSYTAKVTERSIVMNCNDERHKKLILDLLAENGIKNEYKKEILAREYRK